MSEHGTMESRTLMTRMTAMHRVRRFSKAAAFTLALTTGLAACDLDSLLEVEPVDQVPADGLTTPQNARLLVNGAIADFECAYGAYVALTGVLSGELMDATSTAARWDVDRRLFDAPSKEAQYATFGCTALGVYTPLSTARFSSENILQALRGWTDAELADLGHDRDELIALAAAYNGYSYLLLAEGFCSAAIDLSEEKMPADLFAVAVQRLEEAETAARAANRTDLVNLALVGQARAHRGLNNGAQAVAAAQQVEPGFRYDAETATDFSVRQNRIFASNGPQPLGGQGLSVGWLYHHYDHFGDPDPRVAVSDSIGLGPDQTTPMFYQEKYTALDDPIRIASYDEAQLIIAEFEGGATAEAIINDFHADAGLPPVDFSGMTAAEILEHVVEERRSVLWLEGHRAEDVERFNLPLYPAPGTPHRKGQAYGDARCFPLPDVEIRNNPNI
jgi:hypothetical protein